MSDRIERRQAEDGKQVAGRHGMKFSSEINLGALIQASIVLCGLIAWAVTSANRSEQAGHDLTTLQTSMSAQLVDLRSAVTAGLTEVRQQISTLPDQRAKLDNEERRLNEVEARLNSTDQRMSVLERATIEMRADINQMLRAANMALTAGRGSKP